MSKTREEARMDEMSRRLEQVGRDLRSGFESLKGRVDTMKAAAQSTKPAPPESVDLSQEFDAMDKAIGGLEGLSGAMNTTAPFPAALPTPANAPIPLAGESGATDIQTDAEGQVVEVKEGDVYAVQPQPGSAAVATPNASLNTDPPPPGTETPGETSNTTMPPTITEGGETAHQRPSGSSQGARPLTEAGRAGVVNGPTSDTAVEDKGKGK